MRLSQAIEGWKISVNLSPATVEGYSFAFKKYMAYLGDPELESITKEQVRGFFYHLRTTTDLSSASHKAIWRTIRSFYNWASEEFKINRPDDVPAPEAASKEIIPFTLDEVRLLSRACEVTAPSHGRRQAFTMHRPTALRDQALLLLMLDTGVRASECARLNIQDLNFEAQEVVILPHLSGRKSRGRVIPFGKAARRSLWRYLVEREEKSGPLFVSLDGKRMNRDVIYNIIEGLGKRAGVNNAHPHRLRHTFAIQFLRNGGDVFTLQRLLGHASLEMVRHYLHLAEADDQSAHRRASPADCWRL